MGNSYERSPNSGNGNNAWNGYPDGHLNNNNVNNSYGVPAYCEKSQIKVGVYAPKSVHSCKERLSRSQKDEQGNSDGSGQLTGLPIDRVKKEVSDFKNLYRAIHRCKKNVMWKDSTAGFVKNALVNAYIIKRELLSDTYKLQKYACFTVHEKKERFIVSTKIRDRSVQRSLCDNYVYGELTKHFIRDNGACLIGRGTDDARDRLTCHLQKYFRKHGVCGYVLCIDLSDYFGSTKHSVAIGALTKRIENKWALDMMCDIVHSFNLKFPDKVPNKGMGLGSQMTQLTQLAVLDDLDHFIKEKLRIKHYVRYMDDLILIHEDKNYIMKCLKKIENELGIMELKTNKRKTHIQHVSQGIHFLGFSFRLTGTGKVVRTILPKKISKERKKLRKLVQRYKDGIMTKAEVDECYKAWKAHVKKANCYKLLKRMDKYYESLYAEAKDVKDH